MCAAPPLVNLCIVTSHITMGELLLGLSMSINMIIIKWGVKRLTFIVFATHNLIFFPEF